MNNTCSFVYFNGDLFFCYSAIAFSPPPCLLQTGFSLLRFFPSFCFVFNILEHGEFYCFDMLTSFPFTSISSPAPCQCEWMLLFTMLPFSTSVYFWFMIFNNINLSCIVCCVFVRLSIYLFFSSASPSSSFEMKKNIFFFRGFSDMSAHNKNRPQNYKLIIAFVLAFKVSLCFAGHF